MVLMGRTAIKVHPAPMVLMGRMEIKVLPAPMALRAPKEIKESKGRLAPVLNVVSTGA